MSSRLVILFKDVLDILNLNGNSQHKFRFIELTICRTWSDAARYNAR